jgi:hypothetical protein
MTARGCVSGAPDRRRAAKKRSAAAAAAAARRSSKVGGGVALIGGSPVRSGAAWMTGPNPNPVALCITPVRYENRLSAAVLFIACVAIILK